MFFLCSTWRHLLTRKHIFIWSVMTDTIVSFYCNDVPFLLLQSVGFFSISYSVCIVGYKLHSNSFTNDHFIKLIAKTYWNISWNEWKCVHGKCGNKRLYVLYWYCTSWKCCCRFLFNQTILAIWCKVLLNVVCNWEMQ